MQTNKSQSRFVAKAENGGIGINKDKMTSAVATDDGVLVFLCDYPHEILITSETQSPVTISKKIADSMRENKPTTAQSIEGGGEKELASELTKNQPKLYSPALKECRTNHYTNGMHDAIVNFNVRAWGWDGGDKEAELQNLILNAIANHQKWEFRERKENKAQPAEKQQWCSEYTPVMEMKINNGKLETVVRSNGVCSVGRLSFGLPTDKIDFSLVDISRIREIHAQFHECIYQAILASASSAQGQDA